MEIDSVRERIQELVNDIDAMELSDKVDALNEARLCLHEVSPFRGEPVDFVRWEKSQAVVANDYNPNQVAPPEMELLRVSIMADGYTQPVVTMKSDGEFTVVDGFHRTRVAKECKDVRDRVHGYAPVVQIKHSQEDRGDRIASTIRHNRARGKHMVEAMSDIVIELKRRNWSDEKISKNLGMDADEVLRLCQITGIAETFKDQEFSQAWEVGDDNGASGEIISDVVEGYASKEGKRKLHTWEKWECYKNGFYAERCRDGLSQEEGEEIYKDFLSDLPRFRDALEIVISEWKYSCEHYLTNERMNRVAWLGQASVAQAMKIPSICRGGYHKLTESQKHDADGLALEYLNKWLVLNDMEPLSEDLAFGLTEMDLY